MRVEFEVTREELEAMSCSRMAFLLVAALARLSRALLMEVRRPGLRVVVWAELAWPRLSAPPVAQRRLALFLWVVRYAVFQAAQVLLVGLSSFQNSVVQGKVLAARGAVEARTVRVWLVMDRWALAALR